MKFTKQEQSLIKLAAAHMAPQLIKRASLQDKLAAYGIGLEKRAAGEEAPWAKGYENASGITEPINSPYNSAMGDKYEEIYGKPGYTSKENPTLKNWAYRKEWERKSLEEARQREAAQKKQTSFNNHMWAASQNVPAWIRDHHLNMNNLLPPGGYDAAVRATMPPYQGDSIGPILQRMEEWGKHWEATPQGQAFERVAKARGLYQ